MFGNCCFNPVLIGDTSLSVKYVYYHHILFLNSRKASQDKKKHVL